MFPDNLISTSNNKKNIKNSLRQAHHEILKLLDLHFICMSYVRYKPYSLPLFLFTPVYGTSQVFCWWLRVGRWGDSYIILTYYNYCTHVQSEGATHGEGDKLDKSAFWTTRIKKQVCWKGCIYEPWNFNIFRPGTYLVQPRYKVVLKLTTYRQPCASLETI